MTLGILACPSSFIFLLLLLSKRYQSFSIGLVAASAISSLIIMASVQLLSRCLWLNSWCLSAGWVGVMCASGLLLWRQRRLPLPGLAVPGIPLSCFMIIYFGITFFIAVWGPPNNWDSMTYHMSRVMHWIQNQSVASYPAITERQLIHPPGAEFLILNSLLLTNSDNCVNLVQWFAMVVAVTATRLTARMLGSSERGCWLAAICCLTLPMGLLQSTTTQNDYAVSAMIASTVVFGLLALRPLKGGKQIEWTLLCAICFGMAILIKTTALLILIPFAIAFWFISFNKSRKSIMLLVPSAVIAFAINSGFITDNWTDSNGSFLSMVISQRTIVGNQSIDGKSIISNILRNIALQMASPSARYNGILTAATTETHRILQIPINDPNTTYTAEQFSLSTEQLSEDTAGYPFYVTLIVLACILFWIKWAQSKGESIILRELLIYSSLLILSYAGLCVFFKWQPWGNRLFLPFFVLTAAPVGTTLAYAMKPRATRILSAILFITSLPCILKSTHHPLLSSSTFLRYSRQENYFVYAPELYVQYKRALASVSALKPHAILLSMGGDDLEYPIWALLSEAQPRPKIYALANSKFKPHFSQPTTLDYKNTPLIVVGQNKMPPSADLPSYTLLHREPDIAAFIAK